VASSGQGSRHIPYRIVIATSIGVLVYGAFLWALRDSSYSADPLLGTYIDMAGSLVAFTFAANAMMRFRGTHDRISLILAFGFVLTGLIEAAMGMTAYHSLQAATHGNELSLGWFAGRTLLGVVLLVALVVEKRIPVSREPGKEIAAATMIVGAVAYLTSAFYFMLPRIPRIEPHAWIPRPLDLLPAAIYVAAAIGYGRRLKKANTWLDRSLFVAAGLNVICHVTMSQSQHKLDACYTAGHVLLVMSYVVVLGGTLLDNAQLFDQVSRLAASDSLTGLANHRHMIEVLESEIERSRRTGRSFAVLLFDLDGLKKINDKYGHLVGSRAIKRVGDVLSGTCRAIDTPARYGGDEFALVLPESGEREAEQAAMRICELLQNDGEEPKLTISMGQAVYPMDGTTIEQLLSAADTALYQMKGMGQKKLRLRHVAACL